MSLDIRSALDAAAPPKPSVSSRCKVGRWLDSIPTDVDGRDDLVATFEAIDQTDPHWRSLDQLDVLAARLGNSMSNKTIANHRAERCRCTL